jgi:hypothetical protein
MADLNFLDSLSEEQAARAVKIAKKAEQMGIPKTLALGIAMNESQFVPGVKDSSAGAIGLMQVMPVTGKALGYTVEQLRDEDTNIEAGLTALKQNLDRTKGDWVLSAALYNAGDKSLSNTNVKEKGIPAETKDYIKKLQTYGVFNTKPTEAEEETSTQNDVEAPVAQNSEDEFSDDFYAKISEKKIKNAADQEIIKESQDRAKAQIGGATAGTAISLARAAPAVVKNSARMIEEGKILAQEAKEARDAQAAAQAAGGSGTAGRVSGNAGPLSTTGNTGGGGRATGRGSATVNYSNQYGLSGIESNKALDTTSNKGGTWDLLNKRNAALNQIEEMFPGGQFVENSNFDRNIMTPVNVGGQGPREQLVVDASQPSGMRALPTPPPISTAPPKPSGLDYVTDLFKGMIDSKVGKGVGTFMRYAGPPAAIADIASEGVNLYQQGQKPSEKRDYGDMALSGLGILAGGATLAASPFIAVPAGLTAAGIAGYRYMKDREAADRANKRMYGQPMR